MPWHIENSPTKCSASKPWAVVKDSDSSVAGCHASEKDAKKQLAALYANDSVPVVLTDQEAAIIAEAFKDIR